MQEMTAARKAAPKSTKVALFVCTSSHAHGSRTEEMNVFEQTSERIGGN